MSSAKKWESATAEISEIKDPNNFLKNGFFGRDEPQTTDKIELSFLDRARKIAPFVKKNGSAIITDGHTESFRDLEPPHIRIKRPMNPGDLVNNRRPGSVVFPSPGAQNAAMRRHMARELQNLMDDVLNTEEWLAAQALRAQVSYTSEDEDVFQVTFPRLATHDMDVSVSNPWNSSGNNPAVDIDEACQRIHDAVSLNCTDMVLGADAAAAYLANDKVETRADPRRLRELELDLIAGSLQQTGARMLGITTQGVRIWVYARQVLVNGTSESLIRPKYAEFIANAPAAEFVTYYAAIKDMKALGPGRVLASTRFSKEWDEEDPSVRWRLVTSSPLCTLRRPNATLSMQVIP